MATLSTSSALAPDHLTRGPARALPLLTRSSPSSVPYWARDDLFYATDLFANPNPLFRAHGHFGESTVTDGTGRDRKRRTWVNSFVSDHASFLSSSRSVAACVAWLAGYHHATTTQLTAATGFSEATVQTALRRMWQSGMVERTRFDTGPTHINAPLVWRLRDDSPLRRWERSLGDDTWLAVTGGMRLGAGPAHMRHNLLVSELALRLAETHPLTLLLGEPYANPERLLPSSGSAGFRGDLVLVRPDGLRIVIELVQSSRQAELHAKMARWGRALMTYPRAFHDSATVVLFLAASVSQTRFQVASLQRAFASALSPEGLGLPGALSDDPAILRARSSLFIGDWTDWFPQRYAASDDFASLRAGAFHLAQSRWVRTALLDPALFRFQPADPAPWLYPAESRPSLLGVPHFL